MDTYSTLRHIADSWGLLAMFAVFVAAAGFAWRPGSRGLHADAGAVPFRHDDRPAASAPPGIPTLAAGPCGRGCDGCACGQEDAR